MRKRLFWILAAVLLITGCGKSSQPDRYEFEEDQTMNESQGEKESPAQDEETEEILEDREPETQELPENDQLPYGVVTRCEWISRDDEVLSGFTIPLPDDFYSFLVSYSCDGLYIKADGYEKLNAELIQNNNHSWRTMYDNRYCVAEDLEEALKNNPEYASAYFPWTYENTVKVNRADERVFSFVRSSYTYLGGAHPGTDLKGYSYDTQSGKELLISDVVTDQEKFCVRVKEKLLENKELKEGGYENWQEIADDILKISETTNFCFTGTGLQVIFPTYVLGPYVMGDVIVELPYEENSDLVKEEYLLTGRKTCLKLEPYESASVDLDGDGEEEELLVSYEEEWDEEYGYCTGILTTVSVTKNGEEKTAVERGGLAYCSSYLMENEEGEYYLYVETASENDWHNIAVFDVGSSGGPVMKGYTDTGAFYEMLPFDAQNFYLGHRLDMMGMWYGFRRCAVGRDGFPEMKQEDYSLWPVSEPELFGEEDKGDAISGRLVLRQDFEADCHETPEDRDQSRKQVLSEGSVLIPCRTDGETWMMFRTEEGSYVDVYYDEMDPDTWERTIGGVNECDLFEGIFYAG